MEKSMTGGGTAPSPEEVFREYSRGIRYKTGLGKRGLYEQNRINERFLVGDQWYGAACGEDRPLVRHNVIKRIAEYKMAVIGSPPLSVSYSAEGIPNTAELSRHTQALRDAASKGKLPVLTPEEETRLVMSALSDYFRTTAERVGLDSLKETVLRSAYCSGTGVLYTYWDERICTGLYADSRHRAPIRGDIACEVLDIENVYFGDPTLDDVQSQPYILIAQRQEVESLRRELLRWRGKKGYELDREAIRPDRSMESGAGTEGGGAEETDKATVITRFWKAWEADGSSYTLMGMKTCRGAVIRPAWDTGLRLYPLAKFSWERRRGCAYGESEIPYLIPNQIAINRMLTASVWAVMMMGMPIMVVNGDIVTGPLSNDPGQVLKVFGSGEEVEGAIHYVTPPNFSPLFGENIASLITNTLSQAGTNNALLGDIDPNNTSAIMAVREAATLPLNVIQSRFYGFCEDVARIWAEFWVTQYGRRALKIEDERGRWYLPFDGERFRDRLISVRVDAGSSTLWSETRAVQTLDSLFDRGMIDAVQYLSRLPKGTVPAMGTLLRELEQRQQKTGNEEDDEAGNAG